MLPQDPAQAERLVKHALEDAGVTDFQLFSEPNQSEVDPIVECTIEGRTARGVYNSYYRASMEIRDGKTISEAFTELELYID